MGRLMVVPGPADPALGVPDVDVACAVAGADVELPHPVIDHASAARQVTIAIDLVIRSSGRQRSALRTSRIATITAATPAPSATTAAIRRRRTPADFTTPP